MYCLTLTKKKIVAARLTHSSAGASPRTPYRRSPAENSRGIRVEFARDSTTVTISVTSTTSTTITLTTITISTTTITGGLTIPITTIGITTTSTATTITVSTTITTTTTTTTTLALLWRSYGAQVAFLNSIHSQGGGGVFPDPNHR
jgi:hypothetical protein